MAPQPIGGAPEVRRNNLAVVLGLLHLSGPMRRAELTDLTGLNRSTVATLVGQLVALGAVSEGIEEGPARGVPRAGRPSPVVRPRSDSLQVLAADVGVGRVVMALIGLGGSSLCRIVVPIDDPGPEAVAALVARTATGLLGRPEASQVVALGISVPGVISGGDGNVRFAPNLGWRDEPFGEMVARLLPQVSVRVGNDGDLGVLAEHTRGVARGHDDVVFVEGDTGVGCGVIVGGRPLLGAGGYAGELGHMSVTGRDGRRCRCGAVGCWETEIGSEAIARALDLPPTTTADVLLADLQQDGDARVHALASVAFYLGTGLGTVVNMLNPRMIVLGGLLRGVYPLLKDEVLAAMAATALAAPVEQVVLTLPQLGGDAVLLGAAETAWQDVLSDPVATLAS